MRVTNGMITVHSKNNINTTKGLVDKYNEQMTTQKKITIPSDDPVVAIRSLRLRDSLNEVSQYTDKNIPDAKSWLEVTETALTNMSNILNDIYKACVNSATGTLTTDDRNTLLKNLSSLVSQLYSEGNADYAGRTVFTGHKTNQNLTFLTDDKNATYEIVQNFSTTDISSKNCYTTPLTLPEDRDEWMEGYDIEDEMKQVSLDRIRLAYKGTNPDVQPTFIYKANAFDVEHDITELTVSYTDSDGNEVTDQPVEYETISYADLEKADFNVEPNKVYYVPETGEMILGSAVSLELKNQGVADPTASMSITYQKTGFTKGDVQPEMYFDCKKGAYGSTSDFTDPSQYTAFTRENQDISYTVSANQELKVNTQAGEDGILSTAIARDVEELMNAITAAQAADDKVSKIKTLLQHPDYADDVSQEKLNEWLEAAKKEQTYLEENLRRLFSKGITDFQNYKQVVDLAKTDVGSRDSRLELTKSRMVTQKGTIKTLITNNEDREMSDILIDYKAAYNAYESSLQAASKINDMTLLKYL